ncbi:SDR family NAD(P)-dependent oxidoreductase [Erwiniaceae bacterium L1_54_6]|nr:SDR family NAD(P)-dependent oxidoreductase [Erwiniaceae bacterium L1_54_6]
MNLLNKVMVITGAGSGIGRAASYSCAAQGATIVALDINGQAAEMTAQQVRNNGGKALAIATDITDRQQVATAIAQGVSEFGHIDILFNSAGSTRLATIDKLSDEDFDFIIDLNLKGTFIVCSEVLQQMIPRRQGRIINCASYCGVREEYANSAYCAAKSAVIMMTKVIALEMGQHNISAVALSPGNIDTELLQSALNVRAQIEGVDIASLYQRIGDKVPLGRVGNPEEIAGLVAFLSSDAAHYINGENIMMTGGFVMS